MNSHIQTLGHINFIVTQQIYVTHCPTWNIIWFRKNEGNCLNKKKKKSKITVLSSQKKAYKLHNNQTTTGFKTASYRIERESLLHFQQLWFSHHHSGSLILHKHTVMSPFLILNILSEEYQQLQKNENTPRRGLARCGSRLQSCIFLSAPRIHAFPVLVRH